LKRVLFEDEDAQTFRFLVPTLVNFIEKELRRQFLPQLLALLGKQDEKNMMSGMSELFVINVLEEIGELDVTLISPILNPLYDCRRNSSVANLFSAFSSSFSPPRFLAHFLGGGEPEIEILLKWIGEPENNRPKTISYDEAKKTLTVFDKAWESTAPFPKIRADLAKQMAVIIRQRRVAWQSDDLPQLRSHLKQLKAIQSLYADSVKAEIDAILVP
jgi:hypothetical protein